MSAPASTAPMNTSAISSACQRITAILPDAETAAPRRPARRARQVAARRGRIRPSYGHSCPIRLRLLVCILDREERQGVPCRSTILVSTKSKNEQTKHLRNTQDARRGSISWAHTTAQPMQILYIPVWQAAALLNECSLMWTNEWHTTVLAHVRTVGTCLIQYSGILYWMLGGGHSTPLIDQLHTRRRSLKSWMSASSFPWPWQCSASRRSGRPSPQVNP